MKEAEIVELARATPGLRIHRPDGREELLVGQKGDTLIHLELVRLRLKRYQVSWTSGLTKQSCALKTDLCSGEQIVELSIVGDRRHAGAWVLLDGERAGVLSEQGTEGMDVPLGVHRLTVEKPDAQPWSTELRYDKADSGCDRLPIPEGALAPVAPGRDGG